MPTRRQTFRHVFQGGWATDFGPATDVSPDQNNVFRVPFLVDADNCLFELSGGINKIRGTTKLNSTVISGSEEVLGLWDFWLQGTAASGTQKRLAKAGTVLYKDDADGTWDSLITGLTDNAVPSFTVFNDIGIYSETGADVPKKWNQSATGDLGTNTPNFSFSVPHKNRLWAAGVTTNAGDSSRVFYSQLDDADTDWAGAGSGSIGIDIDDGDRIMGLVSHKNQLWIFKGPYHGSIHRITGSSPTGSDSFARKDFVGLEPVIRWIEP